MDANKLPSPASVGGASPPGGSSLPDGKGPAVGNSDDVPKVPGAAPDQQGSKVQAAASPSEVRGAVGSHLLPELANIVGNYCADPQAEAGAARHGLSILQGFVHYSSSEATAALYALASALRPIEEGTLKAGADATAKLREALATAPPALRSDEKAAPEAATSAFDAWRSAIDRRLMIENPMERTIANAAFNSIGLALDALAPELVDASRLEPPAQVLHKACKDAEAMCTFWSSIPRYAKPWDKVPAMLESLKGAASSPDFDTAWPKASADALEVITQKKRSLGKEMFMFFRLVAPPESRWYEY